MTRPMPGPPECECREVPAHLWTTYAGAVDPNTLFEYTPECPLHGEVSSPKRLTDAECAAHRWQAASTLGLALYAPAEVLGVDIPEDGNMYSWERPDAEPLNRAYDAWHRFAACPHALEEA